MYKIGFIGTGVMGSSMARNLLRQGFEVKVYNRSFEKAQTLVADGAIFCTSIQTCVCDTDINIMIVGLPSDVEAVFNQVILFAAKGSLLIDMTTSSPLLAQTMYTEGQKVGIDVLDAPVSGGDLGAKNASLSIMVGGSLDSFNRAHALFEAMGKTIIYCGDAGKGQHTKMANQIAIAGAIAGVSEALAYAKTMGLDLQTLMDAISAGAASSWQLSNNGIKMITEDYAPGFYIKHFVKDMVIAQTGAQSEYLKLPILTTVLELYQSMLQENSDLGTQALIKTYLKQKPD